MNYSWMNDIVLASEIFHTLVHETHHMAMHDVNYHDKKGQEHMCQKLDDIFDYGVVSSIKSVKEALRQ